MGEIGIQETKEVAIALAHLGGGISQSIINKDFSIVDYSEFIGALPVAIEGMGGVIAELNDLSSAEAIEMLEAIMEALEPYGVFNIEVAQAWLTAGIQFTEAIFATINAIKVTQDVEESE